MVVLSLFDGMSCGQIALWELGAKIDTYYASEVDKNAGQRLDGRNNQTYTIIFAERTFNTLSLWTMIKQDAAVTAHYAYTPI